MKKNTTPFIVNIDGKEIVTTLATLESNSPDDGNAIVGCYFDRFGHVKNILRNTPTGQKLLETHKLASAACEMVTLN